MANRIAKSRKELRSLGVDELKNKINDLEDHLFQLKMQASTGQLGSPAARGLARKERARALTILGEKTRAAQAASK